MDGHAQHAQGEAGRPQRHVYLIEPDPAERARVVAVLEAVGYAVTAVATLEAAATQGFWDGDPAKVMVVSSNTRPPFPSHRPGSAN